MDLVAVEDFSFDQFKPSCALIMLQYAMKSHFSVTTKLREETTDYHSS